MHNGHLTMCPLSMQTQGCVTPALQHYHNANTANVLIADV